MNLESHEEMFKHVPLALRVLREMKGLSQAAAARAAGIGKSQLSKYEKGKELPKLDSLGKLLTALEVEPVALFYLTRFFNQLEQGRGTECLLIGTAFGPVMSEAETQGFEIILRIIAGLFQTRVEARVMPAREQTAARQDRQGGKE